MGEALVPTGALLDDTHAFLLVVAGMPTGTKPEQIRGVAHLVTVRLSDVTVVAHVEVGRSIGFQAVSPTLSLTADGSGLLMGAGCHGRHVLTGEVIDPATVPEDITGELAASRGST